MSTHIHHKVVDFATMKIEIENIKTHFATKSDVIRWMVGVGIATTLSILGFVTEYRREMREDLKHETQKIWQETQQLRQETQQIRQETQKNTVMLVEILERLKKP